MPFLGYDNEGLDSQNAKVGVDDDVDGPKTVSRLSCSTWTRDADTTPACLMHQMPQEHKQRLRNIAWADRESFASAQIFHRRGQ